MNSRLKLKLQSQLSITLQYDRDHNPGHLWDIYLADNISYTFLLKAIKPYHRYYHEHESDRGTYEDIENDAFDEDMDWRAGGKFGWVVVASEEVEVEGQQDEQWVHI